jgi:hypothetical protein
MITLGRVRQSTGVGIRWPNGLLMAIVAFLGLRLFLTALAFAIPLLLPTRAPCESSPLQRPSYGEGHALTLVGVWLRADGCSYLKIAANGYSPAVVHGYAFFPLYPLATRLVGGFLGGDTIIAGLIVANLAFIAGAVGIYRLAARDFGDAVARRAVLYLTLFPSAFYLLAPFTEAPFLALSVWTLYSARRGWWLWAGLLGLLAALTRTQGLLLALPLAWEVWRQARGAGRGAAGYAPLAIVAAPLGGFLLYNAYILRAISMNVMEVQRAWGMRTAAPWAVIVDSWHFILDRSSVTEAANLFLILIAATLTIAGATRVPLSYTLVGAPQLLLLLTRETYYSPLMSVSRLLIVIFPIFILLGLVGRHPWCHRIWLTISLILLLVLAGFFFAGAFVA